MNITVADVLELDEWIGRGIDDEEQEERREQVRERLFPDGLDEGEKKRRIDVIEQAITEQKRLEKEKERDPMPGLPTSLGIPSLQKWEGLVSHDSPAYRRGSKHDGTAAEVKRMRDIARGSPFEAEKEYVLPKNTLPFGRR